MRTRGTARRLALGAAALLVAACGTSTTPTVAPSATTAPPASQAPAGSPSEAPSAGGGDDRPVHHGLRAGGRSGRRHRHHRRLAGGDPVQPVLPDPGHRGQRRRRDVGDAS